MSSYDERLNEYKKDGFNEAIFLAEAERWKGHIKEIRVDIKEVKDNVNSLKDSVNALVVAMAKLPCEEHNTANVLRFGFIERHLLGLWAVTSGIFIFLLITGISYIVKGQ